MLAHPDPDATLSEDELHLLNEVLSARFGLFFPESKSEILASRLRPRLVAHGLARYMDYYVMLKSANGSGVPAEIPHLVAAVTNHETYFFRETHQFEALFDHGLAALQAAGVAHNELRLLCAGCASGEEPYTLNIHAVENRFRCCLRNVHVDAFDLDAVAVDRARQAEYGRRALRGLSPEQTARYFTQRDNGRFHLKAPFRRGVRFNIGNIVDPTSFPVMAAYDAVFCRNVLIYFSDDAIQRAVRNFAHCLRPGGLLFLGHSESIIGRSDRFEPVALGSCMAYRHLGSPT